MAIMRPPLDGVGTLVAETPAVTYDELRHEQAGAVRLIEGTISQKSEILTQGLVAYQRSHGVPDIRGDIVWALEEAQTPTLMVDMPGGSVAVRAGYTLFGDMRVMTTATDRYEGVAAGDTVLVIGAVEKNGAAVELAGDYLIYGSRAENQSSRLNWLQIAGGMGLMGVGLGIMGWLWGQGYRPFGHRKTGR